MPQVDPESLRALRESGVSSAKFSESGVLVEVAFFATPPPELPPGVEQTAESPVIAGARRAAETLMRGPTPTNAREVANG
jgi:hypothetical protein